MSSVFDPEIFLDATLTEPTEKRPPLPVECPGTSDGLYTAVIGAITSRTWQGKKDPTKSGIALDIPLTIDIPADMQLALKLPPTLSLKDGVMLDLTEAGQIDNSPGKNRRLRIYREATNMNNPGDTFSVRRMEGTVVKIRLEHELWNDAVVEKVVAVLKS